MESKFIKNVVLVALLAFVLVSLTYFTRTVIDIGCANTGTAEGSLKRHFMGMNCWLWEGTVQIQRSI
jgi:hypothetical protein